MRRTLKDLDNLIKRINRYNYRKGVILEESNSTKNIYLIDKKEYKERYTVIEHIFSGNTSEVYNFLYGITKGIELE